MDKDPRETSPIDDNGNPEAKAARVKLQAVLDNLKQ